MSNGLNDRKKIAENSRNRRVWGKAERKPPVGILGGKLSQEKGLKEIESAQGQGFARGAGNVSKGGTG